VLLGPPASGKGTQAELIQQKFGIPATSTGAILRHEARAKTPLGLQVHGIIIRGRLAPDALVLRLVSAWLDGLQDGFLFDGFPRTVTQAEALDALLQERRKPLELVILLQLTEQTILERMKRRLTCRTCGKIVSIGIHVRSGSDPCPNCGGLLELREDDRTDVLRQRLAEYVEKTSPVAEYYDKRSLLRPINGDHSADVVFKEIGEAIAT
jgi:adenylate kinase